MGCNCSKKKLSNSNNKKIVKKPTTKQTKPIVKTPTRRIIKRTAV